MNDLDHLAEIVAGGVRPDWADDAYCIDMREQHTAMIRVDDAAIRGRAVEMLALWAQIQKLPKQEGRAET